MAALRNASDAYVDKAKPKNNFNRRRRLYLRGGSTNTKYPLLYWGLPSGLAGANVHSAKVQLRVGTGFSGSSQTSLQRLSSKFSVNRVKWNNVPGVTGPITTVTTNALANGTLVEFDVQAQMQQVADGAAWYGFRVSSSTTADKFIHSSEARDDWRPVLVIEYSDAPEAPDGLKPDGGRAVSVAKPTLRWNFNDDAGDVSQQSMGIRIFTTEETAEANVTPVFELLAHPTTIQQLDLDDTAYTGLSADQERWYRIMTTDGAGLPSDWSEPAHMKRVTKGTLTITNPAAAPNNFVSESTPPFSWTFTGRTQESYEVILATPEAPEKVIWTSGMITSTEIDVTPPPGKLTTVGKTYRLIVRIWDTINRESVPDDPAYVEAYRDFTYSLRPITVVTNFEGTLDSFRPYTTLEWDDATAPDNYVLLRNGEAVEDELVPSELLVSGTHYRYEDRSAPPRRETTWSIARKVNGETSSANPTVVGRPKAITTMLCELDGGHEVFLFNPDVAAEKAESSEVHYRLGNAPPTIITQSIRGYEGQASGVLLNDTVPGLDAEEQLANLEWFKARQGTPLRMFWVSKVLTVVIRNVTDEPIAHPDGSVEYLVSFDLIQVD